MSKSISYSDTLTTNVASFDTTNSRYSSNSSSYPYSNGVAGSSSTTEARFVMTTGSSAATYIYYNFDCSSIPSNATITSVSCSVKARKSSTSTGYISSATLQLTTGTTTKGSSTNVSSTGGSTYTVNGGNSWSRVELDNIKIRYYGVRGTRGTTSTSYYLGFYGATLTVNYSVEGVAYELTATSQVQGININPTSVDVLEGDTQEFSIDTNDISGIKVIDNSIDVTSQLVRSHRDLTPTISAVPDSVTTSGNISGTKYLGAVGHSVDNPASTSGNDYCSSSGSTATIYYKFDFSDIPDDATIQQITVSVRGHAENTSQSTSHADLNVYSGTTAKGTQTEFTSTSTTTVNITPGNWSISELKDDPRIGFTIGYYGGLVVGATWTVQCIIDGNEYYYTYTLANVLTDHTILVVQDGQQTKSFYIKINNQYKNVSKNDFRIKVGGAWRTPTKIYIKNNNSWKEV